MKTIGEFMKARRRKPRHPEQDLQDALLGTLKLLKVFAFPLRNHGTWNAKTGRYNRVEKHHVAGVPDVAIVLPAGKILWVELKSPTGRPSTEQIAFHSRLSALGHPALIVWRVEDVIRELRVMGAIN